ncbi:protein of unknown function [Candidatus Nitrosocosmicus franklandus]|uniref:Uncharacterized protein n=1 Tax=Candidatus Nitrosocosmicus franklandianus TaxID=1798806 RepID=A0A484IC87_9ARCH|nr:protein of unknown function [Candidatus Nitrosocosmicus franklandus]
MYNKLDQTFNTSFEHPLFQLVKKQMSYLEILPNKISINRLELLSR